MSLQSICVFCGAQNAVPQAHLDVGKKLGEAMAAASKSLVYGGGDCGIMGAVANAAMGNGGAALGVFPRSLRDMEVEHTGLTEIIIVDTMHERKQIMYERSDAFVILPGGCGTMDEMFEILTWKQLKLHTKPIIIFNHLGYWDHLVALLNNIVAQGFARPETLELFQVVNEYDELADVLGV